MKIKDPWIAKSKFKYLNESLPELNKLKWIEFINMNNSYYTWFEDTEDGLLLLQNINSVSEDFRLKYIKQLNKSIAYAEYNLNKKYYEIRIAFNEDYNVISTSFERKVKKQDLINLLTMAKYIEAELLNHGTQVIDEKIIENYK